MDQRRTPEAIARYLAATSTEVTIRGAEPRFLHEGEVAFLMLHGWGASAESLRFLAEGVAAAGYSVLVPTLPGHGTTPIQMMATGPLDWIAAARAALHVLGGYFERIYVLGVSMGGTLTLQLASLERAALSGIITVNAPIFFDRPHFATELMSGAPDGMLPAWSGPDFIGPAVSEITYPARSRKSGIDLMVMAALAREALPLIEAPLLVVQSVHDHIVPKANADEILARAGSTRKSVTWLEQSYHMSQLDLDRDQVIVRSLNFVQSLEQVASAKGGGEPVEF